MIEDSTIKKVWRLTAGDRRQCDKEGFEVDHFGCSLLYSF